MDEYFDVVGYNERSRMTLARLKIARDGKIVWKNRCESNHIDQNQVGWGVMKEYLHQEFCPLGFHGNRMNEFLELSQGNLSIEEYHQAFAKLIHAVMHQME